MKQVKEEDALSLWYSALAAEFGIRFEPPYVAFDQELYRQRKLANDPRLETIKLTKMGPNEWWLVKKAVEISDASALD